MRRGVHAGLIAASQRPSLSIAANRIYTLASHMQMSSSSAGHIYLNRTAASKIEADKQSSRIKFRRVGAIEALAKSIISGVISIPWFALGTVTCLADRGLAQRMIQVWGAFNLWLFGLRVEVEERDFDLGMGAPPVDDSDKRSSLIVCLNQRSHVESWLFLAVQRRQDLSPEIRAIMAEPYFMIANIEYLLIPLLGWFSWMQGAVVVIREWKEQARSALDKAIEKVKQGNNCYMSIEGRRSPDGKLLPYKRGCAVMAIKTGANIVPMIFLGTYDILPFGSWKVNSGNIKIVLGKPISTRGLTLEDRFVLNDRLKAIAEAVLQEDNLNETKSTTKPTLTKDSARL